jgi:hypothetical protein
MENDEYGHRAMNINSIPLKVPVLDNLGCFNHIGVRNPVMFSQAGHYSYPFLHWMRLVKTSDCESVLDKGIHII